jgi:N-acetylmuramoyl-L-alanine amidase
LAAAQHGAVLPVHATVEGEWAQVTFAGQPFEFLLGAPVFVFRGAAHPLAGGAYVATDSLFVPLQWLTGFIPRLFEEGYRYDPLAARFEEVGMTPVIARTSGAGVAAAAPDPNLPEAARRLGFRRQHKIVVDPGHGGEDPGTPGRYLPRGVQEKHVVLAIGKAVATELERMGIDVQLTRTSDVLIPWPERGPSCREDCDLFVSIHVNGLDPGGGRERVRGVETYFLPDRFTTPGRVAALENEALRYESPWATDDPLAFIMKDLERNEYLRESALLAELVQDELTAVHPGGGRRVAQDNFAVLRSATRPAILVETGYGSNREDGRYLASRAGQQEIAKAIAKGIIAYLLRYEAKTEGLPTPSR